MSDPFDEPDPLAELEQRIADLEVELTQLRDRRWRAGIEDRAGQTLEATIALSETSLAMLNVVRTHYLRRLRD